MASPGRGSLPEQFEPQLATLARSAPAGDDWIHEIKFDGYRLYARVEDGEVRLISRNGKDWSSRFPAIIRAVTELGQTSALLDGEVAVVRPDGTTSFQDLQHALSGDPPSGSTLCYFLFDAVHLDGDDVASLPLIERKHRLELLLAGQPSGSPLRYGDHVEGNGPTFFAQACKLGLEGIISKRRNAAYRQGRTRDWLKVKCFREDEFVVGGYTDPGGSRPGFGALLIGAHDGSGALRFVGRAGTGFKDRQLRSIADMLRPMEAEASPFADGPAADDMHWVEPRLVARVAYVEWTSEGLLRHPSFRGLVDDVDASSVRLPRGHPAESGEPFQTRVTAPPGDGEDPPSEEDRDPADAAPGDAAPGMVAGIAITSPDKVMYPDASITKIDVIRHYERVAEWMLPYVADRPLTLVRCPGGIADCFYQKHIEGTVPAAIGRVQIREDGSPDGEYGYVDTAAGLVALAQLGVLEIHTWGSKRSDLDRPDRFTIDLDPDPAVGWIRVIEAALELRGFLGELGLVSFLKTTGGKGLHVVVPVEPDLGWGELKEFSRAVSAAVAADWPGRYTLNMSKEKRRGRILIDYLRNGRGATAIEAWSTRARPGAPVAVPIRWEELAEGVQPDGFNVRNVPARLDALTSDPWEDYAKVRQRITAAMRRRIGAA